MHILLLIVIVPFAILFGGLALFALTLLISLVVEYPLVLLAAVGVGVLSQHLVNLSAKRAVPCGQM